ncbi:MAG: nitrile hydratase [Thermoplasmata archaeon]
MRHVHDRGGWPDADPIDRSEHVLAPWEHEVRALYRVLKASKGLVTTDELRRGIESLDREEYESLEYFERWVRSLEIVLIEKGVFTREELERQWEGD